MKNTDSKNKYEFQPAEISENANVVLEKDTYKKTLLEI